VQRKLPNGQKSKTELEPREAAEYTLLQIPDKTNDITKLTNENDR